MGFLKSLGRVMSLGADPKDVLKIGGIAGAGALAGATGGAPLVASLAGGAMSALGADQATKKQIKWERERAQNAHQWEVQDLMKAGLNPILSAGGNGAVTGGISAPTPDFSALANTGADIKRLKNETQQVKNETLLAQTESKKSISQTNLNEINAQLVELQKALTKHQTAVSAQEARRAQAEADLAVARRDADIPLINAERDYNKTEDAQTIHNLDTGPGMAKNLAYHLLNALTSNSAQTANYGKKAIKKIIDFATNFKNNESQKWENHKKNNSKNSYGYM